jgi:predicted GIY-YIG superfamily endonuclease
MLTFWTYMLKCSDGSYYIGHTDALETRISQHQLGIKSGYTKSRRPVQLVWSSYFDSRDAAFGVERQIKGWRREKKEALIRGDYDALPELSKSIAARPSTGSG